MAVDAPLPDDVETLKAMLLAEREAYRAELREQALRIEQLKQRIAKLQHERFGQSSERRALLEQLELQLLSLRKIRPRRRRGWRSPDRRAWPVSPLPVASRPAGRCPITCRASVSSIRYHRPARAAAARCTSLART